MTETDIQDENYKVMDDLDFRLIVWGVFLGASGMFIVTYVFYLIEFINWLNS